MTGKPEWTLFLPAIYASLISPVFYGVMVSSMDCNLPLKFIFLRGRVNIYIHTAWLKYEAISKYNVFASFLANLIIKTC